MPASPPTAEAAAGEIASLRPGDARRRGHARRRQRRRRGRRPRLVDAMVAIAVGSLVTGFAGARRFGLAAPQPAPPSAATVAVPTTAVGLVAAVAAAAPSTASTTASTAPSTTTTTVILPPPFADTTPWPAPVVTPGFALRPPDPADPVRVLVVGDALATGMAAALTRTGADGGLAVRAHTVAASGLARPDVYEWPAQLATVVEPGDELVVVALGMNDTQPLAGGDAARPAVGSSAWTAAYRVRLARLVAAAGPRPVAIVGLPAVESPSRDRDLEAVRAAIAAEAAVHVNVRYVDLNAAVSDGGRFVRWLDVGDGAQVALRTNDGEQFTTAGYDLAAAVVTSTVWPPPPPDPG